MKQEAKMLPLVEHFFSIQGEGRRVGKPSIFFRFGGCNMRCQGFNCTQTAPSGSVLKGCDTLYAVYKSEFADQWSNIKNTQELLKIVDSYNLNQLVDIVLTGGEPLIHAQNSIFAEFITELRNRGHHITFETNGTIDIDFDKHSRYTEVLFALSIKLSNSAEPKHLRVQPKLIAKIAECAKESFFKFVVDKDSSSSATSEIKEIISYAPDLEVFCMPLGGSAEEVNINCEAVIDLCKKEGYTYSDRLHVRIWDSNRGV